MSTPQILGITKAQTKPNTPNQLPYFKGDGLSYVRQCLVDSNRSDCERSRTTLYFRVAGSRCDDADLQSFWQNTAIDAADRLANPDYEALLATALTQLSPYLTCANEFRALCRREISLSTAQGLIDVTERVFRNVGLSLEYQGCKLRSLSLESQHGYYGIDPEHLPIDPWLLDLISEGLLSSSRPDVRRVEIDFRMQPTGKVTAVICPLLICPDPKDSPPKSSLKSFKTARDRASITAAKQLALVGKFVDLWDQVTGKAVFENGYFKRVDWSCNKTFG